MTRFVFRNIFLAKGDLESLTSLHNQTTDSWIITPSAVVLYQATSLFPTTSPPLKVLPPCTCKKLEVLSFCFDYYIPNTPLTSFFFLTIILRVSRF